MAQSDSEPRSLDEEHYYEAAKTIETGRLPGDFAKSANPAGQISDYTISNPERTIADKLAEYAMEVQGLMGITEGLKAHGRQASGADLSHNDPDFDDKDKKKGQDSHLYHLLGQDDIAKRMLEDLEELKALYDKLEDIERRKAACAKSLVKKDNGDTNLMHYAEQYLTPEQIEAAQGDPDLIKDALHETLTDPNSPHCGAEPDLVGYIEADEEEKEVKQDIENKEKEFKNNYDKDPGEFLNKSLDFSTVDGNKLKDEAENLENALFNSKSNEEAFDLKAEMDTKGFSDNANDISLADTDEVKLNVEPVIKQGGFDLG